MARFRVQINGMATNGPYAYWIFKDDVGTKSADQVATIADALDGVKADVAALLAGETITKVSMAIDSE